MAVKLPQLFFHIRGTLNPDVLSYPFTKGIMMSIHFRLTCWNPKHKPLRYKYFHKLSDLNISSDTEKITRSNELKISSRFLLRQLMPNIMNSISFFLSNYLWSEQIFSINKFNINTHLACIVVILNGLFSEIFWWLKTMI